MEVSREFRLAYPTASSWVAQNDDGAYARAEGGRPLSGLTEHGFVVEEIVGREFELERIRDFLDDPRGLALFVEGDAGIGKTTLLRAGVELARERNYLVLACRPTAAEAAFSF